jgi:hypothetical protein
MPAERVQAGARTMRTCGRSGCQRPAGPQLQHARAAVIGTRHVVRMPSAARLREARTYSRPDSAARRRRWPSRPTRRIASGAWRTGGREAGARSAAGLPRPGPSADISLLSRGRGKLGADPVRTLFEHVAGPRASTGCPGCPAAGWRDPGGQDHDRRAGQREERRVRAVPLISHGTGRSAGRWVAAAESGTAAGADISSGGSRHAGAPTSRTAKR